MEAQASRKQEGVERIIMTDYIKVTDRKREVTKAWAHDRLMFESDPELQSFVRPPVEDEFAPRTNDEVFGNARVRLVLVERDPMPDGPWQRRSPMIGTIVSPLPLPPMAEVSVILAFIGAWQGRQVSPLVFHELFGLFPFVEAKSCAEPVIPAPD